MKNEILAKFLPLIITLLILSTTIQVQAAEGWEEDFEGETITTLEGKGWFFAAYEIIADIYTPENDHGHDVIDGILRTPFSSNGDNFTEAFQNNTIAYGTWKFDWAPAITPSGIEKREAVFFIANGDCDISGIHIDNDPMNGYLLWISQTTAGAVRKIKLSRVDSPGFIDTELGYNTLTPSVTGPIHIEITRNRQGDFEVSLNDETIIEAIDNEINESTYFGFNSHVGDTGIDNITIEENSIPAFPVGFIICTVTPTVIVLVIRKKRIILKKE